MAEFVDNSLQSYLRYRKALEKLHGKGFRLKVDIDIDRSDEMRIKVRDNAAGIAESDYGRAFRPAALPPDRAGLAEFGMGMKSAACWFAPRWKVRTAALGECLERTIEFDIARIVRDDLKELKVRERPAGRSDHFTEITLMDPHNKLQPRTSGKIKDHLASIYRIFARERLLELRFEGDLLQYEMPKVLKHPYYKTPQGPSKRWFAPFDFTLGRGLRAHGFAALREVASTATAGFALFRRKRLIEGSWDEPYRPDYIFGGANSFRRQRLFGEIHLEGFEVSHTKDGLKWEDHEQPFLKKLKSKLETKELPLLSQAEGFRARAAKRELRIEAEKANARVAETLEKEAPPTLSAQSKSAPVEGPPPQIIAGDPRRTSKVIELSHRGTPWRVTIELSLDSSVEDWVTLADKSAAKKAPREIVVRVSLAHPFMQRFCRPESTEIEALERVAVALALSEITARDAGVPQYGTIRRNVNQLLREVLSKP